MAAFSQFQTLLYESCDDDNNVDFEAENDQSSNHLFSLLGTYVFGKQKKPISDGQLLTNLHNKMDVCGKTFFDIVRKSDSKIESVPVYCDNRACPKKGCQSHRGYKFLREHYAQQQSVNKSMKNPKAWIFTGWRLNILEMSPSQFKAFARDKFKKLYRILSNAKIGSITGFSIHMEIKFNHDDTAYLHFHVVMGGIKSDIATMRRRWGRVVKYEKALHPDYVASYVSKYASKTPDFLDSDFILDYYHLVVWKTQMHRYSISKTQAELDPDILVRQASDYYNYKALAWECYLAYKSRSYKCNPRPFIQKSPTKLSFIEFLNNLDPPPNRVKSKYQKRFEVEFNEPEIEIVIPTSLVDMSPDSNYPDELIGESDLKPKTFKVETMKIELID